VDINKLSLGDKIVAGSGILLFFLILFAPWHEIDFGSEFGLSGGTVTENAFYGEGDAVGWPALIAFILLLAVIAVVLIRKLVDNVSLPELPIPWNQAIFYATVAIPVLLLLKLLLFNDFIAFWAYIDILLGIGMAYGGFLIWKEADAPSTGSAPPTPF
jgi:hypothetical protein